MNDDIGVLSLYATADPHDEGTQPAWRARVRTDLKRLREQLRKSSPKADFAAITSRLDALDQDVETMLDARTPGRGRAMFAAISNGHVEQLTVQVPLSDHVELASTASLRPLVTALSTAGPSGCVAVGADEVRVVDIRLGVATDVATIPHPEDVADRRELKGKGHATATTTHHSSASHHDLFDRREEWRLTHYLHTIGPRIAEYVQDLGWECVAIAGEPKYVHAVVEAVPAQLTTDVIKLPHTVTAKSASKLAAVVADALAESRSARNLQLAERVRDAAMSTLSEAGSCGLATTLAALQEGRVAHLLLTHDGTWSGNRAPDGRLVTEYETPTGVDPSDLTPEPRLDERMIDMAIREGAHVTVLNDAAAEPLAGTEGIGALLRW
jgi:hypothetical protein